ncbi:hypothetical protein GCM10011404_33070 [Sphingomonas prati]|nr:hypothetical protein GCM10011404_33070 [Sphingomonas prati]
MMRHLRAAGLIAARSQMITILDSGRLQEIAEFDARYLRQIEQSAVSLLTGTAQKSISQHDT